MANVAGHRLVAGKKEESSTVCDGSIDKLTKYNLNKTLRLKT